MTVPVKVNPGRLLRTILIWLAGNLFIGWIAIFPIVVAHNLSYYIRAMNGEDVLAPYRLVGARLAVVELVVSTILVLAALVFFNRRQWRRLREIRPVATLPLAVMTAMVLVLPFLWFWFGTDRSF